MASKRPTYREREVNSPYPRGTVTLQTYGGRRGANRDVAIIFDELRATPLWAVEYLEAYLTGQLKDPRGTIGPTGRDRLQAVRATLTARAVDEKRLDDSRPTVPAR